MVSEAAAGCKRAVRLREECTWQVIGMDTRAGDELEREARTVSRGRATRTPLMVLVSVAAAVWLVALVVAGIVALVMWLA
jgi:hypothetical protein